MIFAHKIEKNFIVFWIEVWKGGSTIKQKVKNPNRSMNSIVKQIRLSCIIVSFLNLMST